ncbi:phosphorylcholine transferase LicD [Spirochaetia bacterium]|nr:phosphorylcholine transferase LicD [Spirochaetia bacterium]
MNTLADLQNKLVVMMRDVDTLLTTHKIPYFLIGGSVIGCIRHKGFIPWDDDIDIGVMRSDFEKVESLLSTLKQYVYESVEKHIVRAAPIGQLHYVDENYPVTNAPTIDFFPLERVPDNWVCRKMQHFFMNVFHLCVYRQKSQNRGFLSNSFTAIILFVFPKPVLDRLQSLALKIITHWDSDTDLPIANIWGDYGNSEIFDKSMFSGDNKGTFEGMSLPIPMNPDLYLTQLYGDYMTLPPPEKRHPKHRHYNDKEIAR